MSAETAKHAAAGDRARSDRDGARPPTQASIERVHVSLGERSYDVLIGRGLIDRAGALFSDRFGPRRAVIVTDEHVASAHLQPLEAALAAASIRSQSIVVAAGEPSKSFATLADLCNDLIASGIERRDLVIALGGGVIGDLAGFAAAILRRGVRFVQVPTSLLAQVDSSVGGKTGINTRHGKNLIGAFHQPSLVLADIDVLGTLPDRELRAGYAEVAKYGLLGDAGFFAWLEDRKHAVLARDPDALTHAVRRCVEMKAEIVARDETETGDRALLNLGHTFGHALEAWAGFSQRLLHGEAVAIGMRQATQLSEQLGLVASGTAARVEAHLRAAGLPTRIRDFAGADGPSVETLLGLMAQDKKVQDGRLTLVLLRGIGEAFTTQDVPRAKLEAFLAGERADHPPPHGA